MELRLTLSRDDDDRWTIWLRRDAAEPTAVYTHDEMNAFFVFRWMVSGIKRDVDFVRDRP